MHKKMEAAPTISEPDRPKFLYGWFGFTPSCLQKINTPGFFLFFMCVANIFQSMVINGLVGVVLSSLETRFGLASSQSSWIASAYDVSTVPVLGIVSYFGSRSHRPRWTAAGLFLLVIGTAVFVIPHFTTPVYNPGADIGQVAEDAGMCLVNGTRPGGGGGGGNAGSLSGYLAVFIFGRVLHGIGAVPLYTLAVTFMDDGVSKESFSLYIALFYSAGVLGPAIGYIVGGYMLTIFTDFDQVADPGIDSSSPQWVGAWWVGFMAGAIALFLVTLPVSGYATDLPGAAEVRAQKVSEAYSADKDDEEEDAAADGEITVSWRELPKYFKDLATNPTYVFLTLMVCCDSLLTGGFTAFGPKYVQEQFGVSAALSGVMFGIVVIPGGAGGTIVGGIIVKKMALKCAGIMKAELGFSLAIIVTGFMFFIICDPLSFAGVSIGYNNTAQPSKVNFDAACNINCNCGDVTFQPVCSADNIQYYSPCHAGCESSTTDGKQYYNCSCVSERLNVSALDKAPASTDSCTLPNCNLTPLFMFIFFCAMFCLFACSSMNISATVRCLPATHRSLGIGVQWIFLRLLGTVPGPPVFGAAFDKACIEFARTADGSKGQCLFYDKRTMALLLFTICLVTKLASLVFIILAWKLYKAPTRKETPTKEVDLKPSINGDAKLANGGGMVNAGYEQDVQTLPIENGHSNRNPPSGNLNTTYL